MEFVMILQDSYWDNSRKHTRKRWNGAKIKYCVAEDCSRKDIKHINSEAKGVKERNAARKLGGEPLE